MFDITSLQYNSESPALIAIIYTVLCALVLGSIIAYTYEKTNRGIDRPDHFLQALVLLPIVAATVLEAIGDSVARGLGMLGALSIIRFRTTVRDTRNIVFIFASIAAGISCGVFGYLIAIVGTLGFCMAVFLLRFSSFSNEIRLVGDLSIELPRDYGDFPQLEKTLNTFCKKYILDSYKVYPGEKKGHLLLYQYRIKLKATYSGGAMVAELKELEDLKVVSLVFRNNTSDNV